MGSGLGWRGAEVSWPDISKIRLAVLPYLFHNVAHGRVLGAHIFAPEGSWLRSISILVEQVIYELLSGDSVIKPFAHFI